MNHVVKIGKDRLNQIYGSVGGGFFLGAISTEKLRDICAWCDAHLSGKYNMDNIRVWRFELAEDAMLFSMVWS